MDPATYIHDFFKAGHNYIDALTWHQYYFAGSTAKVEDFINATIMDECIKEVYILNGFNLKGCQSGEFEQGDSQMNFCTTSVLFFGYIILLAIIFAHIFCLLSSLIQTNVTFLSYCENC